MITKFNKSEYNNDITKNFKVKEFACKGNDCDYLLVNIDLVKILQEEVRTKYDNAVIIVSAFRTEAYNAMCGGAPKSRHLSGEAIDFTLKDKKLFLDNINNIIKDLLKRGIKGIGVYVENRTTPYLHIDDRTDNCFWINRNGRNEYVSTLVDVECLKC